MLRIISELLSQFYHQNWAGSGASKSAKCGPKPHVIPCAVHNATGQVSRDEIHSVGVNFFSSCPSLGEGKPRVEEEYYEMWQGRTTLFPDGKLDEDDVQR